MTATSEAERIARYLHLVVELPKPTVDAGNEYACDHLALYKRSELIDALAVFAKPTDQNFPRDSPLLAALLRRAIRHRHGRHAPASDLGDRPSPLGRAYLPGDDPDIGEG